MKTSDQAGTDAGPAGIAHSTFIGRAAEIDLLEQWLIEAEAGRGRVAMVAGEPGIGKTRLMEELAGRARRRGGIVLGGACWEGESGRAYGPFVEALDGYVIEAEGDVLRADVASYAGVLARLVPRLRASLPDLAEPVALQPAEERTRLFDAVCQLLIALSRRAPVTLLLDDLHWADDDTIALWRHVARGVGQQRLLLVTAYRSGEVEDTGALAEALAVLRRQTSFERLGLRGFALDEVGALLRVLAAPRRVGSAAADIEPALALAILAETNGNPFFVRSVVLHLLEEGALRADDGSWRATAPIAEIGLPEGVRQVLNRRLARLSPEARSLLTVGAAIGATFRFDVATAVAELDEARALAVVDEALAAQLIAGVTTPDSYRFVHALVRQALCEALNPSRQVRVHRKIAEAMERVYGERASEHAVEIAAHYHRSRTLRDAERGARFALQAREQAAARHAYTEVARCSTVALELMLAEDPRRGRVLAELGLTYCTLSDERAARETGREGAALIAQHESPQAAAVFLSSLASRLFESGFHDSAFQLAREGLAFDPPHGSFAWALLSALDVIGRQIDRVDFPGIPLDCPERAVLGPILARALEGQERYSAYSSTLYAQIFIAYRSKAELATLSLWRPFAAGEYRGEVRALREQAQRNEAAGRITSAAALWANCGRLHTALGSFADARAARDRSAALIARLPSSSHDSAVLATAVDEWRMATDEGWDEPIPGGPGFGTGAVLQWYRASVMAAAARTHARMGRFDHALRRLASVIPAIERAPCWAPNYVKLTCDAAETLWLAERTDHLHAVESGLREKVIGPDLYYPMADGRLSLARLRALSGDCEEASDWFARARVVLDAQGARPLRAIADHDEALMYARRGAAGDRARAAHLLAAAVEQFRGLEMPGWIRRAERLDGELGRAARAAPSRQTSPVAPARAAFVVEGELWRITQGEITFRLTHSRGLSFLAELLRVPGQDVSAVELVVRAGRHGRQEDARTAEQGSAVTVRAGLGDAGELLDAQARSAYKERLGELREELDEAERFNDSGRIQRLREELELLTRELSRAVGLGGRARVAGSHAERARVNVTRAIAAALKKIAAQHPALGEHFARTIRTGTFCSYAPDPRAPIEWEV